MLARHVSRTDDKGPGSSRGGAPDEGAEYVEESTSHSLSERMSLHPPMCAEVLQDELERTRLIGDIMRLIHEPLIPENTRVAGLTLIGWLARRRPDETPHAIGIEEARESERRIRARAKSR